MRRWARAAVGFGLVALAGVPSALASEPAFAPPPLNPPVANPVYSRADCLVALDLALPPGLSLEETVARIDELAEVLTEVILAERFPVAGFGTNPRALDRIYVQFTQDCARRFDMVERMADGYRRRHPEQIALSVRRVRVEPGPTTKQLFGPWWTDGRLSPSDGPR